MHLNESFEISISFQDMLEDDLDMMEDYIKGMDDNLYAVKNLDCLSQDDKLTSLQGRRGVCKTPQNNAMQFIFLYWDP